MAELSASSSQKSAQDQIDAIHRASLVTFAVLSGLFVFIQFTSTFLAFRHSFAGTYSRGAWEMTHKYNSASEFVRHHKIKADAIAQDAQSSLAKLQSLQDKVFRVSGKTKDNLSHNKDSRTFPRYVEEQESIDHIKKNREIGKQGTNLIRNYVKKTLDDLDAATKAGDNERIEEIIAIAGPRFEAINDSELNGEKERFYAVVNFFSAKAPPVQIPQPIQYFPKPVSEPVITTPVVAIEQPEKEREALAVN
ncbi:hypothetical protein, partial [Aeromonas hydrophila]|uniref:hypothetical protein n=1 Tax=Aeromonas hydrophila TaxID=644 RepID=UPI003F661E26